ncbi:coiled-coil domain-containing protein 172 isoform X2 [Hoplias malabaricus]|uniref:coiled-coil domain-containing protein 172 isoform X2 n=1 Tax=Hoplias malabaricus TaxID=27720 RepID=UPI0034633BE3
MSLNSLFEQILLSEQQVSENNRQLHEVKAAIIKTREDIKSFTEKLEKAHIELDEKAQMHTEVMLQLHLMKKKQQQMEKKKEDLLKQRNDINLELSRLERQSVEEKQKFMKEITTFNDDFNLLKKRDAVFQNQTRSEILTLQLEANTINQEMEVMRQKSSWLVSMQMERAEMEMELQELHCQLTDLERELEEAAALTESLKAEKLAASQKPLTDSTCLRLKKELEAYKEGELELLREALSTEIQFLRSLQVSQS